MLLIDEAELLSRPCNADVERAACIAESGRALSVAIAWEIAVVDAIHHNGVEFSSFSAVQRAEIDAPVPSMRPPK
jgi:hypothetical protein